MTDNEFNKIKGIADEYGTDYTIDYIFKTKTKDEKRDLINYVSNLYGLNKI